MRDNAPPRNFQKFISQRCIGYRYTPAPTRTWLECDILLTDGTQKRMYLSRRDGQAGYETWSDYRPTNLDYDADRDKKA